MTQQQDIVQRKLSILELGEILGTISKACHSLGVTRQFTNDIKGSREEQWAHGEVDAIIPASCSSGIPARGAIQGISLVSINP